MLQPSNQRLLLCDVPVDPITPDQLAGRLVAWTGETTLRHVCYVNAHVHNLARHDEQLRAALLQSDLCYADGVSIVWACRRHGRTIPPRLTSADFLPGVLQALAAAGRRVYFLCGANGIAQRAAATLHQRIPAFRPVGVHHGYFDIDQSQDVIQRIRDCRPDLLIVGMGTPRQERWVRAHLSELNVPVIWTVGAMLDYFAGAERRCPRWIGDHGFEWAYRLLMRPHRRASRYLVGNVQFVAATLIGEVRPAGPSA